MDTKQKILFTSLSENELTGLMEASVRKVLETDTPQRQDALLTTRQASALIRYQPSTIYELVRKGLIPYVKVRGKLLFSRQALLNWARGSDPDRMTQDTNSNNDTNTEKKKNP